MRNSSRGSSPFVAICPERLARPRRVGRRRAAMLANRAAAPASSPCNRRTCAHTTALELARHAPHHRRSTGDMTETPADEDRAPEHTPDPVPEPPVAAAPPEAEERPGTEPSPEQPAADAADAPAAGEAGDAPDAVTAAPDEGVSSAPSTKGEASRQAAAAQADAASADATADGAAVGPPKMEPHEAAAA